MPLFRRGQPPEALAAAMAGVKLGDRVLFAGTRDIRLAAEVATRAGLSGRVVLMAPDAGEARARGAEVEAAGGLVEPQEGALADVAAAPESFDAVIAEETLDALDDAERARALAASHRVLRGGGRLLWIERQPDAGLFGLLGRSAGADANLNPAREQALTEAGFRGVRTLAAAGGRVFVEGIKAAAT